MTIGFPNLAVFAPSPDPGFGYILYGRDDTLNAMPFDARHLKPAGAAVPVAQGVQLNSGTVFSVSSNGVLSYRMGTETASRLLWFDRQGRRLGQVGQAGHGPARNCPRMGSSWWWRNSPTRGLATCGPPTRRAAYSAASTLARPSTRRGGGLPRWARCLHIPAWRGCRGHLRETRQRRRPAEPLVQSPSLKHSNHWSLNGKYIVYDEHSSMKQDLWVIPMTGDRKPVPFLVTPADETDAKFSPDTPVDRLQSDGSGRREVYVQGFLPDHVPAAGVGKWQISPSGGAKPAWRRDGKELYYIATWDDDVRRGKVHRQRVGTRSRRSALPDQPRGALPYDVAADGRFLINTITEEDCRFPSLMVIRTDGRLEEIAHPIPPPPVREASESF